ncbi:MAG: FHA domain-containing protein [Gammaproteobacteria bacterium]|nr:FHA domain-containing protein [Gammaproteobacteria bacterium]
MTQLNLTFKGNFIESFSVTNQCIIGSDPGSDIHIDSLAVQPQHAKIVGSDGEFTISSLNSDAEIAINGEKASSQQLKDGDQIQVGKHTLEFVLTPDAPQEMPATEDVDEMPIISMKKKEAFLQLLNGNNVGKTITLTKSMTNLGKPGVQTAVIARRGGGFFLSHLEGESSPTVNGKPIGDSSYELNSGDSIQIGNIKLLFSLS